jgi:hypothetical protein
MTTKIHNALAIAAILCFVGATQTAARSIRTDAQANGNDGWGCEMVTPTPTGLPTGLGLPAGLLVSPLSTAPLTIEVLAATPASSPPQLLSGWVITPLMNICEIAGPSVLVYASNDSTYFDAQTYPSFLATNTSSSYYANSINVVWGLDFQWPTEQILFFNLGSPAGVDIFDASGKNQGQATNAWELEINCGVGVGSAAGCANGASLQLPAGILYTASADLVSGPQALCTVGGSPICSSDGASPALNEFVYNVDANGVGHLYPPPGWLAGTSTALLVTPGSAKVNSTITFQATVSVPGSTTFPATAGSVLVPASGSVTFSYGTVTLGPVNLNASGVATLAAANVPAGNYSVTATYTGNSTYATSASTAQSLTITPPAAVVTMSFNPTTIAVGKSTTLTWSTTNATACTASGAWSGNEPVSGTLVVTPTGAGSLTYSLNCSGAGGSGSNSATLTANPAPTVRVSVSPTSITVGQTASVTWSSANATACTGSGAWTGNESLSGTLSVTPPTAGSLTYTLSCTGTGVAVSGSTTLTVNAAPHSGGGGAFGVWDLLGLGIVGIARRRRLVVVADPARFPPLSGSVRRPRYFHSRGR